MIAAHLAPFMETMVGHGTALPPGFVEHLVRERYGVDARAEPLTGERDENFRMRAAGGTDYTFKVANAAEDPLVTNLPAAAMLHVERVDAGLPCPRVVRSRTGEPQISIVDHTGQTRSARLVTFLQGKRLLASTRSASQRAECGRLAARLAQALREFEHPASHRMVIWDLRQVSLLESLLADVPTLPMAGFARDFVAMFEAEVAPRLAKVRQQVLHNDLNAGNLLVDEHDESRIAGVIDFGDAVHTALVGDIAIAIVAQITTPDSMEAALSDFVRAYHAVEPLRADELEILNTLVAARMVQGLVIPSWHRAKNPTATHFPAFDPAFIERRIDMVKRLLALRISVPDPA